MKIRLMSWREIDSDNFAYSLPSSPLPLKS